MRYTYIIVLLFITGLAFSQQPSFTNSLQFSSTRIKQSNSIVLPDFTPHSKNYYNMFKEYRDLNNAFYTGGSYYYPYSDKTLSLNNSFYQQQALFGCDADFNTATLVSALVIGIFGEDYLTYTKK